VKQSVLCSGSKACLQIERKNGNVFCMTATLSKSQADLPRLVEIASQGEDVLITVEGKPKARLTRANIVPGHGASPKRALELGVRVKELTFLREKYRTGKVGLSVDQILEGIRSDRP
jgi:prevent-host-death family protein